MRRSVFEGREPGEQNVTLDGAEFIDMGALTRDSGFKVLALKTNSLFGWSPKLGTQW